MPATLSTKEVEATNERVSAERVNAILERRQQSLEGDLRVVLGQMQEHCATKEKSRESLASWGERYQYLSGKERIIKTALLHVSDAIQRLVARGIHNGRGSFGVCINCGRETVPKERIAMILASKPDDPLLRNCALEKPLCNACRKGGP